MGFFSNLVDAFTGKSARQQIQTGTAEANAAIKEGLRDFKKTRQEGLEQSLGFFQPELETGRPALAQIGNALGIFGPEAQSAFFNNFQNDPGFLASQQAGIDAINQAGASRGLSRSGGQLKSLFDFGQRNLFSQFQDRLSRLANIAGLGSQAAGASADITQRAFGDIGEAQFGAGQLFANNAINQANALAQASQMPINNIMGLINAGAQVGSAAAGAPSSNFFLN